MAARAPAALRRLATYGDGWLLREHTPPAKMTRTRQWLAEQGRNNVPFTVFGADTDEQRLAGFAEVGGCSACSAVQICFKAASCSSISAPHEGGSLPWLRISSRFQPKGDAAGGDDVEAGHLTGMWECSAMNSELKPRSIAALSAQVPTRLMY